MNLNQNACKRALVSMFSNFSLPDTCKSLQAHTKKETHDFESGAENCTNKRPRLPGISWRGARKTDSVTWEFDGRELRTKLDQANHEPKHIGAFRGTLTTA